MRLIGSWTCLEQKRKSMAANLQWEQLVIMTMALLALVGTQAHATVNLRRQKNILHQIQAPTEAITSQVSQNQSQTQTQDPSPMVFFEVTRPIEHPEEEPCSVSVLQHDFGFTYGKPPLLVEFNLPKWCPQKWSQVVMEWKATCKGRQFDRIAGVWLGGVEILRTCTAEPTAKGIEWTVLKDITKYSSLLERPQILELKLNNLVDKTYTGVYHVNVTFHFYGAKGKRDLHHKEHADLILPISLPSSVIEGAWFQLQNESDMQSKSLLIPPNAYRAVLEIFVSFHSSDEFWYTNPPNVYIEANNLSGMAGNGCFREVVAYVDDMVVGAVWPFPVVYTGGINPLFWRPVSGIGSFDLPSYEIEITPFLGRLLDGKQHKFSFSVTNALSVWFVDANLHLWLDEKFATTTGELTDYEDSPSKVSLISNFKGLDGSFDTSAHRKISYSGWVKSSYGKITAHTSQDFKFVNSMTFENSGDVQIVHQNIKAKTGFILEEPSGILLSAQFDTDFPMHMYYSEVDKGNDTTIDTANFTNTFNKDISIVAPTKSFFSSLENTQHAEGYIVIQGHLVSSGLGSTQETYKYRSTEGCYSRILSARNYTLLSDHTDNFCGDTA